MKKLLLVGLLIALCCVISPVLADPSLSTNKLDYVPQDTVNISGTGFISEKVIVTVTRPDKITKTDLTAYPDEKGDFFVEYFIDFQPNNTEGTYDVDAIGSNGDETVHIEFTDCVAPPPIPEFPSMALPVGMMIGAIGLVYAIKSREK